MRVTEMPIVIGVFGTISKGLKEVLVGLEVKGNIETNIVEIGKKTEKRSGGLQWKITGKPF